MTSNTHSADLPGEPDPDRTRSALTVGIAAVVFVAVLAGVAVFVLSDDGQPVVADTGATPLIRLAAMVPVDEPGFMIEMADLEGMRARAEVPRLATGASPEESQRYLDALRENGALPLNLFRDYLGGDQHTVGWHDELGVDPAQLHGAGRWGDPPDQVLVVIGTIDPAAVEAAVQSVSPLWDEELPCRDLPRRGLGHRRGPTGGAAASVPRQRTDPGVAAHLSHEGGTRITRPASGDGSTPRPTQVSWSMKKASTKASSRQAS